MVAEASTDNGTTDFNAFGASTCTAETVLPTVPSKKVSS